MDPCASVLYTNPFAVYDVLCGVFTEAGKENLMLYATGGIYALPPTL